MKWLRWLGPAVFVISLAIRLIGISWGLPNDLRFQSYHPDEPINLAVSRLIEPAHLDFTPGWYNYGTLFLTLSRVASGYCPLPGETTSEAMAQYDRCCLLAGRIVSALAGAGTAWVLFAVLWRRTHWLGALAAGLAVALAPAFVVHSRFDTVDVTAAFLLALSLLFALRLVPDKEGSHPKHYIRWAVLSGMFAGLSAGTKYLGILVILGLYVAVAFARRPDAWRLYVLGTAAGIVSFVFATPGVFLDYQRFMEGFGYETAHAASGHGLVFVDVGPSWAYHILSLGIGFGTLGLLLGGIGLLLGASRRRAWALVTLAFALPYFLVISASHVDFLRYTFPLYVPLCIGFGWLVGQSHIRKGSGRFVVVLGIVALGIELWSAAQYTEWMAQEDPRDQAGRFFKDLAAGRPNLTIGVTDDPWFYTPALYPGSAMSRPMWQRIGPQTMAAARRPSVIYFNPGTKPDYVTFSSLESWDLDRLQTAKDLSPDNQALVDRWKGILARLKSEYKDPIRFGGAEPPRLYREDMEYVHPYVYVWKRKDLP